MNFFENITLRKNRTKSETDVDEFSSSNTTLEGSTKSLVEVLSDETDDEIQCLKQEIAKLKMELISAHDEISNLSIENSQLKETISKLSNKHNLLIKTTKKLSSNILTPTKKTNTSQVGATLTTPLRVAKNKANQTPTGSKNRVSTSVAINPYVASSQRHHKQIETGKNNICLISSNKTNKILSIAECTFAGCNICHYLTPNCGIIKLLSNLYCKISNFTMRDYCIIFIGEDDFQMTKNYSDLIVCIREALSDINHTNVILCLPTYKFNYYSAMYNWRIEIFNNLLYHDIQSYNYALLLDSNLNLSCDYSMFLRRTGKLNNHGMSNIFCDLKYLISNEISPFRLETVCDKVDMNNKFQNNSHRLCEDFDPIFRE